nr:MAG TPA: hypothetical protein [Caudoviricetes sp.]
MKLLCDTMPCFGLDCPFFDCGKCKVDNRLCIRMSMPMEKRVVRHECRWLREEKK